MSPNDVAWTSDQAKTDPKLGAYSKSFAKLASVPAKSLSEEKTQRKQRLAGSFRILSLLGLAEGVAGHITMRDPSSPTPFGSIPLVCISGIFGRLI